MLLWPSDDTVAHSEGGKSSRTSGWSICAMTGWACLFCMIFVISGIKASGSSTNAFFFLWYGRSRSKARSLHEKKLLSRKLQHGHWWSHETWQIIKTKQQSTKTKGKTQIPQPDLRLTIKRTAKQTAKGARAQQKQPQKRFAKDTVVKTHCVASDSKTCSKRISCHPVK